jgi:esterase
MPLARKLETSFELILPDLRNHGRSPHDSDASLAAMAKDVLDLMITQNLEPAFLMGHSLGGRVAMRLALDHPDSVEKLVIADMAPRQYGELFPEVFKALQELNLKNLANRTQADEMLKRDLPDSNLRAFLLSNLERNSENQFVWRMDLAALNAFRQPWGNEIKAENSYPGPSIFLRGEKSDYVRDADLAGIQALFPFAQMKSIAGAGHWLHVDQTEIVSEEVKKFLLY